MTGGFAEPAGTARAGGRCEEAALERLGELLRERGGLVATLLPSDGGLAGSPHGPGAVGSPDGLSTANGPGPAGSPNGSGPAQVVAGGPRAREHPEEYELLMEAIYEGYLLHYGAPRLLRPVEADLGLLAGDELYALGLTRLVALGDLAAVAELADLIALTALAQGEGRGELAAAIWSAGAHAIGWGSSQAHRDAKALARVGDPRALEAMRAAAQPGEPR